MNNGPYLLIDGCPCPAEVAPQVYIVLRKARQTAASIYRGSDAEKLLNAHGKHSQRQLFDATPAQRTAWDIVGTPNRPGESEHELCSDGNANEGPIGRHLAKWQVGVDSGTNTQASRDAISHAAAKFGWFVRHPYRTASVEGHHWCFGSPPKPRTAWQRARIALLARTLPRH